MGHNQLGVMVSHQQKGMTRSMLSGQRSAVQSVDGLKTGITIKSSFVIGMIPRLLYFCQVSWLPFVR